MSDPEGGNKRYKRPVHAARPAGRRKETDMLAVLSSVAALSGAVATLLWVVAVILVIAGIVTIVRGSILPGIVLIVIGLIIGPGGVSIFS